MLSLISPLMKMTISLINGGGDYSGSKRMMQNAHYLGDDFYPAIVDKETFDAATAEIDKCSAKLGRDDRYKEPSMRKPLTAFRFGTVIENHVNPVRQAEYLYSLIESEVI